MHRSPKPWPAQGALTWRYMGGVPITFRGSRRFRGPTKVFYTDRVDSPLIGALVAPVELGMV